MMLNCNAGRRFAKPARTVVRDMWVMAPGHIPLRRKPPIVEPMEARIKC